MGEFSIALGALRASADQLDRTAAQLTELSWPTIEPTALPGAAVYVAATSGHAPARLGRVVAEMNAWAAAARAAAVEFERAELGSADGLPLP